MMSTKQHRKLIVLSTAIVALLSFAGISAEQTSNCACIAKLDKTLPLSHPANRSAVDEVSHVSWLSWFTGSNSSRQFHYLDLLELLTRSDDDGRTRHTTS